MRFFGEGALDLKDLMGLPRGIPRTLRKGCGLFLLGIWCGILWLHPCNAYFRSSSLGLSGLIGLVG